MNILKKASLWLLLTALQPFVFAAEGETDLTALSLENLAEITIIGASKYEQKTSEVAAAVHVITRDEIKAFGWRTLNEILASVPGFYSSYDRQYAFVGSRGLSLPGDYNTRILATIDGNRINDVVYDEVLMGQAFPVDIDLIERIEVIPGPGGAVYGQNALLAVVNIVTRNGQTVAGTEASAAYQTLSKTKQGRITWGKTLDNGTDVLVSASGLQSKGQDLYLNFPSMGVSGLAQNLDGARDRKLLTKFVHGPWTVSFIYSDYRKDDPTAQYDSDALSSEQYQRDREVLTHLKYQDNFLNNTLQLSARLFAGKEDYYAHYFFTGQPVLSTGNSTWRGAEINFLSTYFKNHKIIMGFEVQDNTRRDQNSIDLLNDANSLRIPGSGWRAGVYVQDEWIINEQISSTVGLRFDRNSVVGNSVSPRAALIWKTSPSTSFKALYGRAHRSPNTFERDYDDQGTANSQVANLNLKAESIDTFELVLDKRMSENISLQTSLYQWRLQNLIVAGEYPLNPVLSQYQNSDPITAKGLELSFDQKWANGNRLRSSLAYQQVVRNNGERLANSPRFLGKLNFSGLLPKTSVRVGYEMQYMSNRLSRDGADLGSYWLSNLNFTNNTWVKDLDISLGIYNLFDHHYFDSGSRVTQQDALEQDSRSVRLKLDYHF